MDQPEPDYVMTVKEVATYLKMAESTVYRLAQEKRLPARKVGRLWRFSKRALDTWLAGQVTTQEGAED